MGSHVNAEGKFQSDKYPTCPAGKVPLSTSDPMARDLLAEYARRRRAVDPEFADDLFLCLHEPGVSGAELNGPVMEVSKYCDALRTWQHALHERVRRMEADERSGPNDLDDAKAFVAKVDAVFNQMTKSNLLWRVIYEGQELRTTPCPVHKGRWSGCAWPEKPEDACACMDGSNVTGWLSNPPKGAP